MAPRTTHDMRDAFDFLYEEGAEPPKLMSIDLHDRLIGPRRVPRA